MSAPEPRETRKTILQQSMAHGKIIRGYTAWKPALGFGIPVPAKLEPDLNAMPAAPAPKTSFPDLCISAIIAGRDEDQELANALSSLADGIRALTDPTVLLTRLRTLGALERLCILAATATDAQNQSNAKSLLMSACSDQLNTAPEETAQFRLFIRQHAKQHGHPELLELLTSRVKPLAARAPLQSPISHRAPPSSTEGATAGGASNRPAKSKATSPLPQPGSHPKGSQTPRLTAAGPELPTAAATRVTTTGLPVTGSMLAAAALRVHNEQAGTWSSNDALHAHMVAFPHSLSEAEWLAIFAAAATELGISGLAFPRLLGLYRAASQKGTRAVDVRRVLQLHGTLRFLDSCLAARASTATVPPAPEQITLRDYYEIASPAPEQITPRVIDFGPPPSPSVEPWAAEWSPRPPPPALHGPSVAVRPASSPRAQQMAGYIIMYPASHHLLAHNHKAAANADLQNQRERRQSRQSGSPPLVVQTSSSLVCWEYLRRASPAGAVRPARTFVEIDPLKRAHNQKHVT